MSLRTGKVLRMKGATNNFVETQDPKPGFFPGKLRCMTTLREPIGVTWYGENDNYIKYFS